MVVRPNIVGDHASPLPSSVIAAGTFASWYMMRVTDPSDAGPRREATRVRGVAGVAGSRNVPTTTTHFPKSGVGSRLLFKGGGGGSGSENVHPAEHDRP